MGMDNVFARVKRSNRINFNNHDVIDVYFFDDKELENLIDFRNAYDLDEIITDIVKNNMGDYVVLDKEDINIIIQVLQDRFYKNDIYNNEFNQWLKYDHIIETLELINKLFDYDRYYLLYIFY